mgnify:CR=1 FL=1
MNTIQLILPFLLILPLTAAERRQSSHTVTEGTPLTGAGTVQRMGICERATQFLANNRDQIPLCARASAIVIVAGTPCCPAAGLLGLTACKATCVWGTCCPYICARWLVETPTGQRFLDTSVGPGLVARGARFTSIYYRNFCELLTNSNSSE